MELAQAVLVGFCHSGLHQRTALACGEHHEKGRPSWELPTPTGSFLGFLLPLLVTSPKVS